MNDAAAETGTAPREVPRYAEVVFNIPVAQCYTYRVPPELDEEVVPGCLVEAPFGARGQCGCVVAVSEEPGTLLAGGLKTIASHVSPEYRISDELLEIARFIAGYYFVSLGQALSAVSMVGFCDVRLHTATEYQLAADWRVRLAETEAALTARQMAACEALEVAGLPAGPRAVLARAAGCGAGVIAKLEAAGLLIQSESGLSSAAPPSVPPSQPHKLGTEQRTALEAIGDALREPRFQAFLLHGITGSGKTEVYLQAIAEVLERGGSALCLVPEISLTPQTVERFERRFQCETGVFHSQLTRRDKLLLYLKIRAGAIRLVIGARSAVFAPLERLGIIVVDEEHDGSYKQGESPRYHARDVALVRAQRLGIPVVMGSATPGLESYHNAQSGKYTLLHLPDRAGDVPLVLPPVAVIDLTRQARETPAAGMISPALHDAIQTRLDRKEQSLLFLNRRGFSNFLFCPACKWVARCDEDDVALTVHKPRRPGEKREPETGELDLFDSGTESMSPEAFLKCHFCGMSRPAPRTCPECGADDLLTVGAGTQRIERELDAQFPGARILRMDYDTAGGRQAFLESWKKMVSGEADIILGTQMIAKGIHLEKVTLVGVVLADVGLFLPDFRAEERCFTLLTQVAGRAGRTSPGEVIFQTYLPNHTAIRHAMRHDFVGFFAEELGRRRQLNFPPFTRLISLTLSDPDRERAFAAARQLVSILWRLKHRPECRGVVTNGPTIAPIARLGGRFRCRILIRAPQSRTAAALLRFALDSQDWKLAGDTRLAIDVDPVDLM
ncbi:primosomal protein N' [Candidatus Poribacteria bacterium]|nr:primosomal protein N' [Candidatus Poribacteria bacterium]